jgi:branched-chain amino acid transport system ATP-binding protein
MTMALFAAEGLHMRFGRRVVLERIDLKVEERMFAGIIGPNGAGKTTCFNVLTGRYRPNRGRIVFDGEDITGLPPDRIARRGLARSFQIITLFDEYSARDNILQALPAMRALAWRGDYAVARDADLRASADAVLESVGLGGRAQTRAKDLSYGDRRALEIGVALASRPRILFLDEPTSGLGASGRVRLRELLARLKGTLTIVTIEHDLAFLFSLADRVSVIQWGQVIAEGTPDELRADPWVRRSNLGKLQ